ncbi:MAG: hypothetical protein U0531_11185 [Dehalococcoidia bacterium]
MSADGIDGVVAVTRVCHEDAPLLDLNLNHIADAGLVQADRGHISRSGRLG